MLICKTCKKVIANTNPKVHYGLCAVCSTNKSRENKLKKTNQKENK